MEEQARKGEWVQIHQILLTPSQRASQLPDDTKQVPLEARVNGFLIEENARRGDTVTIQSVAGRRLQGVLEDLHPRFTHGFGENVPELMTVGPELRNLIGKRR